MLIKEEVVSVEEKASVKEAVNEEINYALSNSLGFGGHNASILIGKYSE